MPDADQLQSHFYITLGGEPASPALLRDLEHVTVESSLHLPDVATLVLHDPRLDWVDFDGLLPGTALQVSARAGRTTAPLFDGEIVEIEPEFGATQRLTVRAFDRLHRLARGTHVRSFVNVTEDDLVRRIAGEVGLSAEVRPVPPDIYAYVLQANETNLAFLQRRAAQLGYLLYVEGTTLYFAEPEPQRQPIELAWGDSLYEFRPRMTTIGQVSKTIARGWDPASKQQLLGEARSSMTAPKVGFDGDGATLAARAFNIEAQDQIADRPVRTQELAERLALAGAERHASRFVEADGVCVGQPALVAGVQLALRSVGKHFSGTYFVTGATHSARADEGYQTSFSISGLNPATLLGLLMPSQAVLPSNGLVIGVVSDNADPESLGRVRLMFPWLSPDHASDWARVSSIGAGQRRGIEFLPEIGDEVLVGFEMGDIHYPYVLGGLWNGVDPPPQSADDLLKSGMVRQRSIVSRSGHTIVLDDDEHGGISIVDRAGNRIVLDTSTNALTITARGNISLQTDANLALKAKGSLSIEGQGVEIKGQANVDINGAIINLN